jgi:hypothetical protein
MFLKFLFVALVCWIFAAVMVFGVTGVCSPECQTDVRDFLLSSEKIRGRFSILRRVDSYDFNKILSEVVLMMSEQQRVKTPDLSVAGKYGAE